MNVGLSPNKCLIRRSCYYPHHGYYYEGTDWRELTGENRGDLGLTGWGGEDFSGQADSEESQSGEEMVGPMLETLRSADGLRARKGELGSQEVGSNPRFAFPGCETNGKFLNTSPSMFPLQENGDPVPWVVS